MIVGIARRMGLPNKSNRRSAEQIANETAEEAKARREKRAERDRARKRDDKVARRQRDAAKRLVEKTEKAEIEAAGALLTAIGALWLNAPPVELCGPVFPAERLGAFKTKPEILMGTRTYANLGKGECKWPVGDPARSWFRCCGRQVTSPDIPYCNAHGRVAYLDAPPPKAGNRPLKVRQMVRR